MRFVIHPKEEKNEQPEKKKKKKKTFSGKNLKNNSRVLSKAEPNDLIYVGNKILLT